ncbi:MAG TPA: tRNA lysidine(34) synthetase TilS, partial [Opitutales bacterium]|nr:tRNA lysidine(34) synthetase TilS [Opitutales bacterium]
PTPDWPRLAQAFALRTPLAELERWAVENIAGWERGGFVRAGLAVSGGADSVALTLLVWAHFPQLRERLLVLHFNHRLRGAASEEDASFVRALAAGLSLPYAEGVWENPPIGASEEAARNARMEFLHSRADHLLFGHNESDVAENLLMRLARGSSLDGLSGPRPVHLLRLPAGCFTHVRPLLSLSGALLRERLAACAVPWREDATNFSGDYARSRIRREVVPLLSEIMGRDFAGGAARSRYRIAEAARLVGALAHGFLPQTPGAPLELTPLRNQGQAIMRRTVELWLEGNSLRDQTDVRTLDRIVLHILSRYGCDASFRSLGFEIVPDSLQLHRPVPVPRFLRFPECSLAPDTETFLPTGASLRTETLVFSGDGAAEEIAKMRRQRNKLAACLSLPEGASLSLRPRRSGDAYQPLGAPGVKTLRKIFIDRKIPREERYRLPIVLVEGRVAWCPMLLPADEFRLDADSRRALRLTYLPNQPTTENDAK